MRNKILAFAVILAVLFVFGAQFVQAQDKPAEQKTEKNCCGKADDAKCCGEKKADAGCEKCAQTLCPVSGEAINKDVFTEYKGKKVYFCCADCKTAFDKEPEKYAAKLPSCGGDCQHKKETTKAEAKGCCGKAGKAKT
jgi:YHS domain-containing protein